MVDMRYYMNDLRMRPCANEASFSDASSQFGALRFGMEKALSPLLLFQKDGEGSRPGAGAHDS
jgi:hypothetical protein